jgi:probable F420-dependent oxidoreductase
MRPFRFFAAGGDITDARELAATARRAESLGYAGFVLADHLVPTMAALPTLAAVAATTDTLRVGTFVLNVDLRHPAVLAQELATLDVLSGGRLDIGIGAGWNRPEYDAVGLPFDPVGTRVSRLTEAVAILKGCFAEGGFDHAGANWTITGYDAYPKPVQKPHPPLFIGGGGRRTLTLAGREADIVGLAPRLLKDADGRPMGDPRSLTLEAAAEKIAWVREAAGPRFADLEFNVYPSGAPVTITDDALAQAAGRAEAMTARTGVAISAEEILHSPHHWIGTVDELIAKCLDLRERLGITSFMLGGVDEAADIVSALAGH